MYVRGATYILHVLCKIYTCTYVHTCSTCTPVLYIPVHVTRENDLRVIYTIYTVYMRVPYDTRSLYVAGLLLTGNNTKSQEIQV